MQWRRFRRSVLLPAYLRDRRTLTLLVDYGSASRNCQGTGKFFRTRPFLHLRLHNWKYINDQDLVHAHNSIETVSFCPACPRHRPGSALDTYRK